MSYIRSTKEQLYIGRNSVAVIVAKVYLFCLAFRMIVPLKFLQSIVGSAALSLALMPHILGVLLLFTTNKWHVSFEKSKEEEVIIYFWRMVFWFALSSIIMAVIMQTTFGNQGSESAFDGIKGMILYYIQYALILYYNYYVFKLLSISEITEVLQMEIIVLLIIGYAQIMTMLYKGNVATIYDRFTFLGLNNSDNLPKVSLTTDEGAHAGYVMGSLVFPFLYASRLVDRKRKISNTVQIALWLPVLYFTYSTAAYLLFVINTIVYIFLVINKNGLSRGLLVFLIFTTVFVMIFFTFSDYILDILPKEVSENIRYILIEKITDEDNGSSMSRRIGFYYNWGAFLEYPIIGVGNGCQGYFLVKYMPEEMYSVPGFDARKWLETVTSGVSNGSLFWPSILSGYGIIGTILFLVYMYRNVQLIWNKRQNVNLLFYMFFIGIAGVLVAGFATDFVAKYYIWFVFSIPLYSNITTKKSISNNAIVMGRLKYIRN